ncbi:hypothetical protein GS433_17405 [Rhodococcus hoagii]|uniref:hypothetical protein n=1 Tax=Rhodococcus hoagii TaxID=43767 RepID=UPI0007CD8CDD|nr:hypothetical protein [Prescottella equi]MBM4536170.1 hypothetical protein [Prescottella equi]NKR81233.1 hypothetical protein [Prescottella equi]ORJ93975.1 hypothetical protein A6F56_21895 [Prescottella equi]ORL05487.1 hypothetical protein A6I84_20270 [Prescottella equi]ORL72006.1 hypothetical protein A5N75_21355 [Prescottella equi]
MPVVETAPRKFRLPVSVAALALSSVALAGCTADSTSHEQRDDSYSGATAVTLDFDDAGAKQFGVTTAALSAQVIGSDRDDIEIRRSFEFTDGDKPDERIDTNGSGLTISASCPDRFAVGRPTCVALYEIAVPYGTVVRGSSQFGDLTVTDTRAPVDLNSRYGDVTLVTGPGGYAVDAVSVTGPSTIEVPQDRAGIPVRLRSGDGAVSAMTDPR